MSAAELIKLQAQISAISTQFNQPKTFVSNLLTLMDKYQDRTFQTGNIARMNVLMPAYHIPPVVIHQLEVFLAEMAQKFPEDALEIADLLWEDKHYEAQWMAVVLLGNVHDDSYQAITERLSKWINPNQEKNLLAALLSTGSQQLRSEKMDIWLKFIRQWLRNKDEEFRKIGLQALQTIIDDPNFEDFPLIYKSLEEVIFNLNISNQKQLLMVLGSLANRLPMETAAFLHTLLNRSNTAIVQQFVRRCLPLFDKTIQNSLKVSLK